MTVYGPIRVVLLAYLPGTEVPVDICRDADARMPQYLADSNYVPFLSTPVAYRRLSWWGVKGCMYTLFSVFSMLYFPA